MRTLVVVLAAGIVVIVGLGAILLATLETTQASPAPASVLLPPGDALRGESTFRELRCWSCHEVPGTDLPAPHAQPPVHVPLGTWDEPPTDGQLVTSIVNPSHEMAPGFREEAERADGLSRMGSFAHAMTVQQLLDLVAFLRDRPVSPGVEASARR